MPEIKLITLHSKRLTAAKTQNRAQPRRFAGVTAVSVPILQCCSICAS